MSDVVATSLNSPSARPHAVKRNVLASWLAHGTALALGFFLMPYVLGVLGVRQYGDWVFINSFVAYGGLLYLGFGETVSRFVARHHAENRPERLNEVVSLVMAVYLLMSGAALLAAGALCWLAPTFDRWNGDELLQVRIVIILLGLNFAVGMCGSVFGGVLLGLRRFDLERSVTIVFDFVRFGLIFGLLRETWGLATIASIYLFITLAEQISLAVLAYRVCPSLRIHPTLLRRSVLQECSGFSAMAMVSYLSATVINASDSIVIGFMLGTEAIVPYYIALRLTQFIRQPIDKVAHICLPTAGALAAEPDQRRLLNFLATALGVVVLLIGGMFIGGWFFGGHLIQAWMGPGYSVSHRILCILLGAQLVALPCGVLRAFLFGSGYVRAPGLIYLLEAACNLGVSIFLCQSWGIVGVAWGTAIPAVVIEAGLLLPYALKTLGLSTKRLWSDVLWPQVPPLAALFAYSWAVAHQPWMVASWPELIGVTIGGGAILGVVWIAWRKLRPSMA